MPRDPQEDDDKSSSSSSDEDEDGYEEECECKYCEWLRPSHHFRNNISYITHLIVKHEHRYEEIPATAELIERLRMIRFYLGEDDRDSAVSMSRDMLMHIYDWFNKVPSFPGRLHLYAILYYVMKNATSAYVLPMLIPHAMDILSRGKKVDPEWIIFSLHIIDLALCARSYSETYTRTILGYPISYIEDAPDFGIRDVILRKLNPPSSCFQSFVKWWVEKDGGQSYSQVK
jgi:hypothetical protein